MASIINATTTNGVAVQGDNSGSLQLQTNNGTTAVTIDTSQNVGIGTSSPSSKLHVVGDVFVGGNNNLQWSSYSAGTSGVLWTGHATNNTLDAYTTGTLRMRIDSSGNLLIGKTTYSTSVNGLHFGPADNGANIGLLSITGNSTNAGATAYQLYSTSNSTFRFYVNYAGTIFAQSTTITGISDQRLKENIVDLPDGLDAVMALKPRKFDWKEGKGKDIKGDRGFIAQEFETVFPDMIEEWKDPAPEGEEPYKAVNANLIPTLVKAIQELKAELDATKAEVQALKGVA